MIDTNKVEFFIVSGIMEGYLKRMLFSYKIVDGCFEGKIETSYLLIISEKEALIIARAFNQKCVLYVNKYREASLVYIDGTIKPLGWWMVGESNDNYTIDNGVKYICSSA